MRNERWTSEAAFFDRLAERQLADVTSLEPRILQRYQSRQRWWFSKEFRFRLMGKSLQGSRVLDLGCGEGTNAILLASLGARVTGIDISPKAIQLASERARRTGVGSRVDFICAPIELAELPESSFDFIWGDGVLHHLVPELELVMQRLVHWARPGARVIFAEPLSLNPMLRRLRLKIPIHTDATPDERPLEARELALIRRYLPDLEVRHFTCLARLNRFLLKNRTYEYASPLRQRLASAFNLVDYGLLSVPGLKTLGGIGVISATLHKQADTPERARSLC